MAEKKLYRSVSDKKLFGVCGGLAKYFDIDPTIVRIILLVMVLCCGIGAVAYLIMALVMPEEK
ncbi:MAG: PspC domain-containing protein [Bacteroidaceae bacterium]|nr:PspC domain-containing protein [Bacteroidaceae bacterium]